MYKRRSRSSIVKLASSSSVKSILKGNGSSNLMNKSAKYCHKKPGSNESNNELKFLRISSKRLDFSCVERVDSTLKSESQNEPNENEESTSSHC